MRATIQDVSVRGIPYQVQQEMVGKDSLIGRPHWVFSLINPQTGETSAKLTLKAIKPSHKTIQAEQIWTLANLRRQGLATFLYSFASAQLKRTFSQSPQHTDEGAALWKAFRKLAPPKNQS